jgi:hypothetical protein
MRDENRGEDMKCCLYEQEKQSEEIKRLEKRIEEISNEKSEIVYKTYEDKPKLASAIYFVSFMALFIAGLFLNWHWGWLTAISIIGISITFSINDNV